MINDDRFRTVTVYSLLKDFSEYNLWANTEIVTWVKSNYEENLTHKQSVPNITLNSILRQLLYNQKHCLNGLKNNLYPVPGFTIEPISEKLFQEIIQSAKEIKEYVSLLDNVTIRKELNNVDRNSTIELQRLDLIFHCINNNTFLWGQLRSIGSHIGMNDLPQVDFIYFLQEFHTN